MYGAFAPLVGALITIMGLVNSRFSDTAGTVTATLVVHATGLVAVGILLVATREKTRHGALPPYYYLGGVLGVGTVFSTMYSFSALGASLAVALALLGQALCSVVIDSTGFLGRTVYPLSPRRAPGLLLAVAGVAVMAGAWRSNAPALLAGLVAGVIPGLTFALNSELGRRKGIIHSTLVNYVTGLATTAVIAAFVRPAPGPALASVVAAGPVLALGGGLLGVAVVASMNFIFPRIPAFSATLLLFAGQALSGVVVDWIADGVFDIRKLIGTLLVLSGLGLDTLLTRRSPPHAA